MRERRQRCGLSMRDLATQAGLSHAMISFVERELRNPTLDILLRMSVVMDVDLAELLREAQTAALLRMESRRTGDEAKKRR